MNLIVSITLVIIPCVWGGVLYSMILSPFFIWARNFHSFRKRSEGVGQFPNIKSLRRSPQNHSGLNILVHSGSIFEVHFFPASFGFKICMSHTGLKFVSNVSWFIVKELKIYLYKKIVLLYLSKLVFTYFLIILILEFIKRYESPRFTYHSIKNKLFYSHSP